MRVVICVAVLLVGSNLRADEPGAGKWAGKPVLVATTVARLYDIHPDGNQFLFADGRKFGCFDRAAGKMIWSIDNTTIHDAKFSPDARTIAAGEWQNGVNFYDAATGKKLHTIPAGEQRPGQVYYRADGTVLYHTSWSSYSGPPWTLKYSIVHYDLAKQKVRGKLSGSVTYHGTNPWLSHRGAGFVMEHHQVEGANTTTRRTVNYTDPISGKKTPTIDLHVNDVPLELSPDGKRLVAVTLGEQARLVDTTTGKTIHTLDGHKRQVTNAGYSPDGKLVATVTGTWSNISTRGAVDPGTMIYKGPAEFAVWDAATGKLVARSEFPTTELDFIGVQFSPNSKFAVATTRLGPNGKGRAHYAFGAVPFGKTGGIALGFPYDEQLKPKPAPVVAGGPVVGDPLDRLIDTLVKSNKSGADRVDALFLAALGRFPTATEQERVKAKYGDKLTSEILRKLLDEIAATPEFEAHLRSFQKRSPFKPVFPGMPFQGSGPFGGFGTPNG